MLTLLVGTGLYLTVLLKGLQFRVLPLAFRIIFHKDFDGNTVDARCKPRSTDQCQLWRNLGGSLVK
jgi:hypothetical protein